jgi:hypothetical protein
VAGALPIVAGVFEPFGLTMRPEMRRSLAHRLTVGTDRAGRRVEARRLANGLTRIAYVRWASPIHAIF